MKRIQYLGRRTLDDYKTRTVALLFALGAVLGVLGTLAAIAFPDYVKASNAAKMHAFHSWLFYRVGLELLLYSLVGYVSLKVADRCMSVLLDRAGFKVK